EIGDFSARSLARGNLDSSRSYIEKTKAFPGSVRVDAVQTYTLMPTPAFAVPGMPVMPTL
ncbi:hypothetical protein LJD63_10215, partial [Veillonella nakazawae]